jgi:ADP-heptose:LPS heptosyltransferase
VSLITAEPPGTGAAFPHPAADRGAPIDWSAVRRVLLVRPDNLGDVVMLTPAVRALARAAPRAELVLLASPAGSALAPLLPRLHGVRTVSPSWQDASGSGNTDVAGERALVDLLAREAPDVMLVFTSHSQSPWPAAHAGMLAGIGVRAVQSTEFGGAVATHWVTPPPETAHQVDRCLHLLAALGVPSAGTEPELRVPPDARRAAARVLAAAGVGDTDPFVLLAPGASCPTRRYDPLRFAEAARSVASPGRPVLVTGSPREADLVRSVVDAAAHSGVRPLGNVDVPALAAVVDRADLVICNNSGPLHLADALGTPVVATWAGTERLTDMPPRHVPHTLLQRRVPCSPCRQFRCPFAHECLDVPAAEVADAAFALLERAGVSPPV